MKKDLQFYIIRLLFITLFTFGVGFLVTLIESIRYFFGHHSMIGIYTMIGSAVAAMVIYVVGFLIYKFKP